jgi:hypothetical protein
MPHCGSLTCHKQHRTAVKDLWESRNDIRSRHDNVCIKCTFILDDHSRRSKNTVCSACRIIASQKKREKTAQTKEDRDIEKRADDAAVRITLLEFERRQQAAFAPKETILSFIEQNPIAQKNIATEEA